MGARSGELVAADESTVAAKSLFDAIVVEGNQSDGRLPDPASTDESDGCKVLRQANYLIYQLVTSETDPRRRGR